MLRFIRIVVTIPVRLYQWLISPLVPPHCNYYPTCSEYSRQAIMKHGALKGSVMGLMRIGRCSSRFHGGNDPAPAVFDFDSLIREYRKRSVKRNP